MDPGAGFMGLFVVAALIVGAGWVWVLGSLLSGRARPRRGRTGRAGAIRFGTGGVHHSHDGDGFPDTGFFDPGGGGDAGGSSCGGGSGGGDSGGGGGGGGGSGGGC